jgi:hypothetical protein
MCAPWTLNPGTTAGAGIEPAGHDTAVCVELVEVHEPFIGSLLTFEPVVLSQ